MRERLSLMLAAAWMGLCLLSWLGQFASLLMRMIGSGGSQ